MNKKTLIYGGGAVALILVYLWYKNQSAAATSGATTDTTGTTADQTSNDYATLAGMLQQQQAQEQSDISSASSAQQAATAQEQSDYGTLSAGITTVAGQEATDVSGIQQQLVGILSGQSSQGQAITDLVAASQQAAASIASITSGLASQSPGTNGAVAPSNHAPPVATITTNKGGPFYEWFQSIFGRAPAATVAVTNPVYVAWTHGVAKATVKKSYPKGAGI